MSDITAGLRTYFRPSATTEQEFGQYVSEDMVEQVLTKLQESRYSELGRVCYVFGAGKHPRSSYTELEGRAGVRVLHCESVLPRGLRFIPSHRGLVKIEDPSMLAVVFKKLMEQSTAVCLMFDAALEPTFVDAVRNVAAHGDHSFGIKVDPGYFIYFVDADRDDSPTGMVEFLSYGTACPWKSLFEGR